MSEDGDRGPDLVPDLVVQAARMMTPRGVEPGSVWVADGRILRIGALDEAAAGVPTIELAEDEVLLPGLVDTHVHVNEPGRTEWEGFATATRAAAAGGVTTLLDMPLNCIPPTVDRAALEAKQHAATGQCWVDVGFWGGAVPDSLGRLEDLWDAGVFGFKCFLLDSGVPEFPHLSTDQLHAATTEIAAFGGRLIVHAEDADLVTGDDLHSPQYTAYLATRPPASEATAIDRVIEAVRATGCRTHIVHLSAADALPAIERARDEGLPLTVETCPHYLTLAAEEVPDRATQYKCCPPVRDRANAERLWEALSAGVIDFVASDHSPCTPELKGLDDGDFGLAWGGISSLQLGLALVWTGARERGLALDDVSDWMSTRPARVMGVPGKGVLTPGHAADLVVFAPEQPWTVDAERLHHRHAVSPYDGREVTGMVRATFLAGQRVDVDGDSHGRFLVPAG